MLLYYRLLFRPPPNLPAMIKTFLPILLVSALLAGCAYVPTIRQGNYLDQEHIAKIHVGMTKAQVKFVLGTPMLDDPFHAHRWDYVYYVKPTGSDATQYKHIIVYFKGNVVSKVVKPTANASEKSAS